MNQVVNINDMGFLSKPLMEVNDPELKEHTTAILKHANGAKSHMFAIAVHLLIIKDKGLWKRDGFDGIGDYALKVLGYKPVTTSNMINIAREYLTPTESGEYKSILARDDGEDYTLNQLLEVKSLGEDVVIQMDKEGEISPSMSVRAIRQAVKNKKGKGDGKKKATKKDKVGEMERSARPVTDVDLCITRVIESIPVILADDRFKDNVFLRKACETILNQIGNENGEDDI